MPSWFILSAVGRDRPGLVADLAQLVFDCEANLEDSRMTLLGNEFAAILLKQYRQEALATVALYGPSAERYVANARRRLRDRLRALLAWQKES